MKPDVATLGCLIEDDEIVPREEVKASQADDYRARRLLPGSTGSVQNACVSSCAIRIAMETLAVIPIRRVIVNVAARVCDSSTGHFVNSTMLAVHFTRDGLERLNLDRVDPCAALEHFPHRVKFKKTQGLQEVEPMSDDEQWVTTTPCWLVS